MSTTPRIDIPQEAIAEFCRRNRIRKLSVFGSVLRDDFTDDSDIDVLVEFEQDQTPGLEYFAIQRALAELFDRNVQLLTERSISRHFIDDVVRDAQAVYDSTS